MPSGITRLELATVDSTNTYAREHFAELADGTLVVSSEQTAGRGRLGRVWHSPAGVNIYATLVIKTPQSPFLAAAMLGLAGLATLRHFVPGCCSFLKWPNDVYVEDRKIAGILCESAAYSAGRVTGLVAGIGLNVNLDPAALAAVGQPATSLAALAGRDFDLKKVLQELEKQLLRYYITHSKSPDLLFFEWREENRLLGEELEVVTGNGEVLRGRFAAIEPDGTMILDCCGQRREFNCGDVKIRREAIDWQKFLHKQREDKEKS